ncbi:hypothetical protein HFO93_09770 [Rhizobium leguminosarum]|uniref:hypothetical protein n=1 Tax=Rhizobium leguminosarum TaxID=384 RepID=UPI001C94C6C2|nr:hypothetical protein [Rhizobium leguminosarum]MBY5443765.1 hypothetical protein [Rhizobium leguminosarum]
MLIVKRAGIRKDCQMLTYIDLPACGGLKQRHLDWLIASSVLRGPMRTEPLRPDHYKAAGRHLPSRR